VLVLILYPTICKPLICDGHLELDNHFCICEPTKVATWLLVSTLTLFFQYLKLKNQSGGVPFCAKAYVNREGTCWAIAIQTILTFSQATSTDLNVVMRSINLQDKQKFINDKLKKIVKDPELKILDIKKQYEKARKSKK
jgi:hypothetical protein